MSNRALSPVKKRSIVIRGHKTSVSLEDAFWVSLRSIADERGGLTLGALVNQIDDGRNHANLSSFIRLFVLGFYQDKVATANAARRILEADTNTVLHA